MKKVILFIAASLDGYIARKDGSIDWLFADQDYGYKAFYDSISAIILGNNTYKQALTFPEFPYANKECYVFSKKEKRKNDEHVTFVNDAMDTCIASIKKKTKKNIWIVGGASIVQECLKHDLIDEFKIFIHPLIVGEGIPLFKNGLPEKRLELISIQKFSSGLVELYYKRRKEKS